MRKWPVLLLSLLLSSSGWSAMVNSIYQANIPVSSQSPDQRTQFNGEGLAQVLVKVSGNSRVLDNPRIKSYLKDADNLAEEFSYSPSPRTPATPYIFHISFDAETINKMLRNVGIPIWAQNRPLMMVWAEYEVPNQPAVIIDDSANELSQSFRIAADQRGLPIVFPMMDVTDINLVSVGDIATMDLSKLQSAAKRYENDAMLIVRIFKNPNDFSVQSKLVMGKNQWSWNINGKNLTAISTTLLNNVTDALAGRYATVVTEAVQSNVTLKVMNVGRPDDLGRLIDYLNHLPPVADVEPMRIEGDIVVLKVSLRGSQDSFIQTLSIGQRLQEVTQPDPTSNGNELDYQWNP